MKHSSDEHRADALFRIISLNPTTVQKLEETDRQIAKYEQELCRLKGRRNGLLPVARLPSELLSKIINIAWSDCASSTPGFLLGVTHISNQWREVVQHTPLLWSRIGAKNPSHMRAALERSQRLPLTMMGILHVNKPSAVEAFRVALGHLNRIRSLDVFAEFYTNPKWFMKLKDQDLPGLKFLTLSKKDHHYRDDIYLPWISKIGAPQLQGLDVQYFAFKSYQKFLLPSLTSLSISGGRFPPLQLLSVLRDLPYLRQLSLTAVLRYSSLEDGRLLDSPKDIVHMAHVQHLSLRGTILVTSIILANLSLPVVTDVEIILESLDCTLHEHFKQKNTLQLSQVLVPIMSLLSTIVPPTSVTKLAFTQGKREGRRNQRYSYQDVVGWGMRTISPMDEQSSRFLLSVLDSQYALHPSRDAEEMLGVVLPTLAAVNLEYLQVGAHITSAKWKEWFGQCNHVTRLSVTGPDDQFLDALHPEKAGIDGSDDMPKVEGNNVGEGTMLFPRLKCLRLEEDSCELYTRELLDKLVSALRSRKSEGCGLANLDVRGVREWSEDLRASLKRTAEMVTLRPPAEVHAEKDIGEFEAEKPNGADRGCQKHDKEDVVGDESSDEEDDDDDRHSYW